MSTAPKEVPQISVFPKLTIVEGGLTPADPLTTPELDQPQETRLNGDTVTGGEYYQRYKEWWGTHHVNPYGASRDTPRQQPPTRPLPSGRETEDKLNYLLDCGFPDRRTDYDGDSIEVAWLSDQSMFIKVQKLGLGRIVLMSAWHDEDLAHVSAIYTPDGDLPTRKLFSDVGAMAESPQWVIDVIRQAHSLYTKN